MKTTPDGRDVSRNWKYLEVEDATHYLECAHQCGHNRREFVMKCCVLNTSAKSGKVRIVVFGDRYWRDRQTLKRVRYVEKWRLSKIPEKQ